MNQVLRINSDDPRITYLGQWRQMNGNTSAYQAESQFFWMFRGTSIRMHGSTFSVANGSLVLRLDGEPTTILVNGTADADGITPIYRADNMQDGDHQLMGEVTQLMAGIFIVAYFEIENSSGGGFDLLNAGPTAQNVPARTTTVDNASPDIIFHNDSAWTRSSGGITNYERSLSLTSTIGSSLNYSFDGVAIWYYGSVGPNFGFFNVSIDGSTPQRLNATSNLSLDQRMLWSSTTLSPGRHNLTLTHDDARPNKTLSLDFFRVLPVEGASTLPSSSSTTSTDVQAVAPSNQNQPNKIQLAVGLTLGLLALITLVLIGVYYLCRRRRRRAIDQDSHSVSPYTVTPMRLGLSQANRGPNLGTQADQQSGLPQVRKRLPQSTQPPGIPTVMGGSEMELGPPPSYAS